MDLNLQTISLKIRNLTSKIITVLIIAALALTGAVPSFAVSKATADMPSVTGTSAILIDGGTGDVLYEKNAEERRDPASITKILTCLVVLETLAPSRVVTIPPDTETVGHILDLKEGEQITVKDLLYGMMLHSANDAAEVLAIETAGSIESFCDMMNKRAVDCGAKSTTFTNPNGLNGWGQENHKTTAYDIAMIAKEAMKNSKFRKLVSTVRYTIPATNKSEERRVKSTNFCLYESDETVEIDEKEVSYTYDGMTGIKTGSTGSAGECFCGSAKRGSTEMIAVVLNAEDENARYEDVMTLLDYGFENYYTYTAAKSAAPVGKASVRRGAKAAVELGIAEDMNITLAAGTDSKTIKTELNLDKDKLTAPVQKGAVLGQLEAKDENGKLLASSKVFALEGSEKGGPLSYIGVADEHVLLFILGIIAVLITLIIIRMIYVQIRRSRKRKKKQRRRDVRRREYENEKSSFDDFRRK